MEIASVLDYKMFSGKQFLLDCIKNMLLLTGGLLKLLLAIGKAYAALSQYDCRMALQLFEELPEHQYDTAWVLTQIGRAHFEQGNFQKVKR